MSPEATVLPQNINFVSLYATLFSMGQFIKDWWWIRDYKYNLEITLIEEDKNQYFLAQIFLKEINTNILKVKYLISWSL